MASTVTVEMPNRDDKKNSVKFFTPELYQAFDNLYVDKKVIPAGCKGVRVTVEFLT